MRTSPPTASRNPERSTLCGWYTTSPSDRITTGPRAAAARRSLERARIHPRRERILQEEARDAEELRVARVFDAVALERAEVVGVPLLAEQLFENLPVAPLAFGAEHLDELAAEIRDDRVVVEQRVVDVDRDRRRRSCWPLVPAFERMLECYLNSVILGSGVSAGPAMTAPSGLKRDRGTGNPRSAPPRSSRPGSPCACRPPTA